MDCFEQNVVPGTVWLTFFFFFFFFFGEADDKGPSEDDVKAWLRNMREKDQKVRSEKSEEKKDVDDEDSGLGFNPWVVGSVIAAILVFLWLVSHEFAAEISFQQFVSDLLSRDIVRAAKKNQKTKKKKKKKRKTKNKKTKLVDRKTTINKENVLVG